MVSYFIETVNHKYDLDNAFKEASNYFTNLTDYQVFIDDNGCMVEVNDGISIDDLYVMLSGRLRYPFKIYNPYDYGHKLLLDEMNSEVVSNIKTDSKFDLSLTTIEPMYDCKLSGDELKFINAALKYMKAYHLEDSKQCISSLFKNIDISDSEAISYISQLRGTIKGILRNNSK